MILKKNVLSLKERAMSKKCPWCKVDVYLTELKHWWRCPECQTEFPERAFPKERTVFDRITVSRDVLAEKLVYPSENFKVREWDAEKEEWTKPHGFWRSTLIPNRDFDTKPEAIAATVAKLDEV